MSKYVKVLRSHKYNVYHGVVYHMGLNVSSHPKFECYPASLMHKHLHDGYHVSNVTLPKGSILQECTRSRIIKSDQMILEDFEPIGYDLYMRSLRFDATSFEFMNPYVIDTQMCEVAIGYKPSLIQHVPQHLLSEYLCVRAVCARARLVCVPETHRSEKVCLHAVELDGMELRHVPMGFRSYPMCRKAVLQNPLAIQWVPKEMVGDTKYERLVKYVLERDPSLKSMFDDAFPSLSYTSMHNKH